MRRIAVLILLLCLAAPAAAQSLFLEKGETASFAGAGWFTHDDWSGLLVGAGVAIHGEADLLVQYEWQEDDLGRTLRTWSPGARLHLQRPTYDSPLGLAVEGALVTGTYRFEEGTWGGMPGYTYEEDVSGVALMGRLTLAPPDSYRDRFVYLLAGVQTLEVGGHESDTWPVAFGFASRVLDDLIADLRMTTADGEQQYLVSAFWIF